TQAHAQESTIPHPTTPATPPTGGCAIERTIPTPTSPAAAPTGRIDSRRCQHRTMNEGTVERDVAAMVEAAITNIGSDPEGAPHRAAMHAGKRHRRARSANDGVGLGDGGRDAVKGEGQRSEEQRRSDEKLLHESSSVI